MTKYERGEGHALHYEDEKIEVQKCLRLPKAPQQVGDSQDLGGSLLLEPRKLDNSLPSSGAQQVPMALQGADSCPQECG